MAQIAGIVLGVGVVEAFSAQRVLSTLKLRAAKLPVAANDEASIAQAIRGVVDHLGITTAQVGVAVLMRDVLLRSFTMPIFPRAELDRAVQFEARKYIPFKIEELVWGYQAVKQRGTRMLSVVFIGMRTEAFAKIQGTLRAAGIEPLFIEPRSLSLARLGGGAPLGSDKQFVGIVEVSQQSAHIVIAKDRLPYFAREVALTSPAAVGPTGPAPQPEIESLLSELGISFEFFTRENPQAMIRHVAVYGPPSAVDAIVERLKSQLKCSVGIGTIPKEIRQDGFTLEDAAVAGLALRELQPRSAIQLMSGRTDTTVKKTSQELLNVASIESRRLVKPLIGQLSMAAVILGVFFWIEEYQVTTARRQMEHTVRAFPDVGWGLKEQGQQELEDLQQQVDSRLAFLKRTIDGRISMTEKLDTLAKALPDGVWVQSIGYHNIVDRFKPQRPLLELRGACFRAEAGQEIDVIQRFFQHIRQDQTLLQGFARAELGKVAEAAEQQDISYRTFEVNYRSKGVL